MYPTYLDLMRMPELDVTTATPAQKDLYLRFMKFIRGASASRPDAKILAAIQYTADSVQSSDAHIAKELVEQGLRAPRSAFPTQYLAFIDDAIGRGNWDYGAPSRAMMSLYDLWQRTGEVDVQSSLPRFEHIHTIVQQRVMHG